MSRFNKRKAAMNRPPKQCVNTVVESTEAAARACGRPYPREMKRRIGGDEKSADSFLVGTTEKIVVIDSRLETTQVKGA